MAENPNSEKTKQSLDGDVTARPTNQGPAGSSGANKDSMETRTQDYGEMNLADAKESGYTDEEGKAVSKTREDKKGSPTGAYTDIGAGRSSAVVKKSDIKEETNLH